jgi:hypothetical protein
LGREKVENVKDKKGKTKDNAEIEMQKRAKTKSKRMREE